MCGGLPQGLLFLQNYDSRILRHPIFKECQLSCFSIVLYNFFKKWIPRANQYAHETRSESQSRSPGSILVSWPERRPEFPSDNGGGDVPSTLSIGQALRTSRPGTKCHQISRAGNPSLRYSTRSPNYPDILL